MVDDPAVPQVKIGHAKSALRDLGVRIEKILAEATARLAHPSKRSEAVRALQAPHAKRRADDAG